jgi:hypothetical protein
VKAWSLRAAYVGATVTTLLALVSAEPAGAHVDVRPRLVEAGSVVELAVELPALRRAMEPARVELSGSGVEVLASRRAGGIRGETRWTVRIRVGSDPGHVPIVLRAVYADGRSVEVDEALTVVPGDDGGVAWAAVGAGVALALALAAAALVVARRRA